MGRNKEGTPIKCQHCDYEWLTKSKMFYTCCPKCMYRVKTHLYYEKFGHGDNND